nr:leucine-rich repeat-containing protein 40 [Quercus suber]
MDSSSATPSRPSGLPKPASRLPVLDKKGSGIPQPKERLAVAPPKATVSIGTSRLQKRSSIASFGRASTNTVPTAISRPPSSRDSSVKATRRVSTVSKSSTGSKSTLTRASSRSTQHTTRPSTAGSPNGEIGETVDHLGSLDDFRSISRQGSVADHDLDGQENEAFAGDLSVSTKKRSSRPSLSDRAVESLQNLPSTPKDRRRSSFFTPAESPMGPPPRPMSAMSRNGSTSSRPGTSDGMFLHPTSRTSSPTRKGYASAKPAARNTLGGFGFTPKTANRRSVSAAFTSRALEQKVAVNVSPRSSSPSKVPSRLPNQRQLSSGTGPTRSVTSRPIKPRPSLGKAFISSTTSAAEEIDATENPPAPALRSTQRAVSGPMNASSAALREQIAAAKAAARREKEKAMHDSPLATGVEHTDPFEPAHHTDPFNQAPRDEKHILRNRVNNARMDGRLNISAMNLKEIPTEVMTMYEPSAMEESNVNWAEVVDLTRLVAANNELEVIADDVFLDLTIEELTSDDNTTGNQFGGLETLDLHSNVLISLPVGLRRLERLTTLDLAHNKLENSALDIISQILTLKDVKLGHNALSGNLPSVVCDLTHLEVLDLQNNRLLGLPEALRNLGSLRVLNLAGNQLTALPMDAIQQMPLVDLDASNNALIGSLFPLGEQYTHQTLRTLDVSHNSLAALTFSPILELLRLRELRVTNNHMTSLPPVSRWSELHTLLASDNKINELPVGFTELRKLRNANFASNELKNLEVEIGNMDNLDTLIITANPLREKKFLSMGTADIRRELKSRLEPEDVVEDAHTDDEFVDAPDSFSSRNSVSGVWLIKPNGLLDLASKSLSDDVNDTLGSFLKGNEVKQLLLQANRLSTIPPALRFGQGLRVLDLSGNVFGSDYFANSLELPFLTELKLSNCRLGTIEPLISQLTAPSLQSLNVSANRLVGPVPTLRRTYPALTNFWANDNRFVSVTIDALRGMTTVNLTSNDIEVLPAEIGLLWDEGLKHFDVGSNAFRVPNYRILEKGTEATLRWLRDRLPAGYEEQRRIELDLD